MRSKAEVFNTFSPLKIVAKYVISNWFCKMSNFYILNLVKCRILMKYFAHNNISDFAKHFVCWQIYLKFNILQPAKWIACVITHFARCKLINFTNIFHGTKLFAKFDIFSTAKSLTEIIYLSRLNKKHLDVCQNQLEIIDFATIFRGENVMKILTFVLILYWGKVSENIEF